VVSRPSIPQVAVLVGLFLFVAAGAARTPGGTDAGRGREALLGQAFAPAFISWENYETLWKQWGLTARPADFSRAAMDRHGLHPAPYPNDGLPMGLRASRHLFGKGVGFDCMLCHASSLLGQSIIGLGNAALDWGTLAEDFAAAEGIPHGIPFALCNVRGTTEASAVIAHFMQYRDVELKLRPKVALPFRTDLCEDVPAWWLLRKKKTVYHPGTHPAQSVRLHMSLGIHPLNSDRFIKSCEPAFADMRAYILTLEPPAYPFRVDARKADTGKELFNAHCARCHGTYGPKGTYPNKVVALDEIGTDRTLARGFALYARSAYNDSWFGQEKGPDGKPLHARATDGYQAPPLDGVWATAPYFHNGSVPTLYHVLNSRARPAIYTRSFRTGKEDFDTVRVGWRFQELQQAANVHAPGLERRKVYDTTQPGRGNGGHTYGDELTEEERGSVIEYLKTL
jgi:hypothetical protein